MATQDLPTAAAPLQLGDHFALDFLNTTILVSGELVDLLTSDEDVLEWLTSMGLPKQKVHLANGALLKSARNLRETLREAIEERKAGQSTNWHYWNTLLAKSPSHTVIQNDGTTVQRWGNQTPEHVLGPVIASAVELLVSGEFDLIRHCESSDCILWFYDRTKSHRRRWCSMKTCGNRAKVAAYRERQLADA